MSAGCRDRGSASSVAQGESHPARASTAEESAPPVELVKLSERQVQAVDSIAAAGGRVERDVDGYVAGIDLSSDRAQADAALVRAVLEFPHLRRLRLTVGMVPSETLVELASLRDLDELALQDAALDDALLAQVLRAMPLLRRFTLRRANQVTDAGLAALADCPELEVVALIEMPSITGASVDALRQVAQLRSLDMRNCGRLTTADFTRLATLSALSELKVGGPAVNDQVLAILARHPALTSLSIEDAQISPAGLQQLAAVSELPRRLQSLSLTRCAGVTDDSLHMLTAFGALETLALRGIMLRGSFLQYVHDASDQPLALKTLIVSQALLTDDALTPLPGLCPSLVRLDLSGNSQVTNAVLETLKQIRSLRDVNLEGTAVTQQWFPRLE